MYGYFCNAVIDNLMQPVGLHQPKNSVITKMRGRNVNQAYILVDYNVKNQKDVNELLVKV